MEYFTSENAGHGQYGICCKCKKPPSKEGYDGCLGTLAGPIRNACCGHGNVNLAYIQYKDGKHIEGDEAIAEQLKLIKDN